MNNRYTWGIATDYTTHKSKYYVFDLYYNTVTNITDSATTAKAICDYLNEKE